MPEPYATRVLRVREESMEPELFEGDQLLVYIARRVPALKEMFVPWDGNGLVVKRVVPIPGDVPTPVLQNRFVPGIGRRSVRIGIRRSS